MSNFSKLMESEGFGYFALIAVVVILLWPVDSNRVYYDTQERGGDWAKWYTSDCRTVNDNIDRAGGVLPYYIQRVQQNKNWQNDYMRGDTQLRPKQFREMERELEQRWRDEFAMR